MDYNSWESTLFEELHPFAKLTHGDIKMKANLLVVSWGDYTTSVPAIEFYDDESLNPLYEIKKWAYDSLPFIEAEQSTTYVIYNPINTSYEAHSLRSMGTKHITRNVSPSDYLNHGNYSEISALISTEMNGTVVCMSTNDKRIPAEISITEKDVFAKLIEEHMDYSDNLYILIPEKSSHVFAGHRTAIERLQENFQQGTTLNITSKQWFDNITKDAK